MDAPVIAAREAAARELAETRARARLGGVFYAIGALAVFSIAGFDALRVAAIAWFLVLAVLRVAPLPSFARNDPEPGIRWMWGLILASSVTWGTLAGATVAQDPASNASIVALMCTIAFATAMAHSFCMRPRLAMLGIALLYVPALAALAIASERHVLDIVMTVYVVYVLLALVRSHREFAERIALEDELRDQRDRYEHLSAHDSLTGLANRRLFNAALEHHVRAMHERAAPLTLAIVDIDHFKRINDAWGHAAGDEALRVFAARLREGMATFGGVIARLGGEEFGVLMPGCTRDDAVALADRFRRGSQAPVAIGGAEVTLTCSIGIATIDAPRPDAIEQLLRGADAALYRAKNGGRDRVCADSLA